MHILGPTHNSNVGIHIWGPTPNTKCRNIVNQGIMTPRYNIHLHITPVHSHSVKVPKTKLVLKMKSRCR
jgi:hypothetical protein